MISEETVATLERRAEKLLLESRAYFQKTRDNACNDLVPLVRRTSRGVDRINASVEALKKKRTDVVSSLRGLRETLETQVSQVNADELAGVIRQQVRSGAGLAEAAIENLETLHGQVASANQALNDVLNRIGNFQNEAIDHYLARISDAKRKVKNDVLRPAAEGVSELNDLTQELVSHIEGEIEQAKEEAIAEILTTLEDITAKTRDEIVAAIQEVVDEIMNPLLETLRDLIESATNEIIEQIRALLEPSEEGASEVSELSSVAEPLTESVVGQVEVLPS